jgi:phosphate transport system ATP-binding protein
MNINVLFKKQKPEEGKKPINIQPEEPGGIVSDIPLNGSPAIRMESKNLTVKYGTVTGVRNISLPIYNEKVTALIGPSGCGKTTFLRALNRMHDLTPNATVTGQVLLDGSNIYAPRVNPVTIRRKVGMVFQKPTPFPTMSIYDNVVAGLKLVGIRNKALLNEVCERALRQAALWDEVKDRLGSPGGSISGGQQQRLSIARALAIEPEVILMDEPTSSLDPLSSSKIEDLINDLKKKYAIVIVTHNMQQAARVSDNTGFFYVGDLVEFGPTDKLFTNPYHKRTEEYLTGKFG